MTTHRRAWIQRAGVVVALAASAIFALPAPPALAEPPRIDDVSASPSRIEAGGSMTLRYTLRFGRTSDEAQITISSSTGKLQCVDRCGGPARQTGQYEAKFKADSNITSDISATITIRASEDGLFGGTNTEQIRVTLLGAPEEEPTVKSISGKVVNAADGEPVADATVGIRDSQGNTRQTKTDDDGRYKFTGSSDRPIAPGEIKIAASKDDATVTKTINAPAGRTITGYLLELELAEPTPTETAEESAAPTNSVVPTDLMGAQPAQDTADEDEGGGLGSLLLILVGGLLVALGVGAIVLLLMRRKEDDEDEDDEDAPAGPRGGPVPHARGAYSGADDATRVANRAGGEPIPPALADAPTMMHDRPLVDDEFPDPYGAPRPGGRGQGSYGEGADWADDYGAPTQMYGNAPTSGGAYGNAPTSGGVYGNAPTSGGVYGNAPSSGGAYGSPVGQPGGYRGPSDYDGHYDEPTGRYDGGGYGAPYGGQAGPDRGYDQGGYDQESDYGQGYGQDGYGGQDDGYGQGGGYGSGADYRGDEPYGGRGYDQDQGGYGQYGGGGYDERYDGSDYDRIPGQRSGGYDDRGYDQDRGGYYGDEDPAQRRGRPQPSRAERRSLDWLDD